MNYNNCPLYGLKSKKKLKYLLHVRNNKLLHQDYIAKSISPYIDNTGKPRLIEPPSEEMKSIQKRIKVMLNKIDVPEYVFPVSKEDLMPIMQECTLIPTLETYSKSI